MSPEQQGEALKLHARLPRAGRPAGTLPEIEEQAREEYRLREQGYSYRAIQKMLYPNDPSPENMQAQIRKRVNRYMHATNLE